MAIAPDITRLTKIQDWVATTNLILANIGNGGSLTPVAGKFPIAGPGGKIDSGWIDFNISIVDADTLQGADRAYFEGADNLLTGIVDPARLSGTYTIDVQGNVTGSLTGNADTATNADKLDGQHGSYYQNADNLNAGTVPSARLSGTYAITVNGNASTATKWASPITFSLTGAITGSASVDGSGAVNLATTASSSLVLTTGDQTIGGNKTFSNNVIVNGDLTVNGTTATVNTDNMAIEDNVIVLNTNETGAGVTLGFSGLEIERGTLNNARFLFRESDDEWVVEDLVTPGTYYKIFHEGNATGTTVNNATRLNGFLGSYYLDRANHTGTQFASTISDFGEAVDDRVSTLLIAGTGISLSYNDNGAGAGTLTINGNTGTVTSLSIVSANGISGTVANATTTPAITLSLGAITPTSVNSVVISGSATPTLSVTGTSSISGTNTGDQTITLSGGDVQSTGPMTNGTYPVNLTTTGVAAGTYHQVTVDTKGRVTAGANNTQKDGVLTVFTNTTAFTLAQVTLPSWTAGDIYRMRIGFSVATNANRTFAFRITLGATTLYASGTTANLNTAGVEAGGEIEFYLTAETSGPNTVPRLHGRIEIDKPSAPTTGFGNINKGTVHAYAVIGNGGITTTPSSNILTITETPSGAQTTTRYNYVLEKL